MVSAACRWVNPCDRSRTKTPKQTPPKSVDLAAEVASLIHAGIAKNTRVSHVRDVRYFWARYALRVKKRPRYPIALETIQLFIIDHIKGLPKAIEHHLWNRVAAASPDH